MINQLSLHLRIVAALVYVLASSVIDAFETLKLYPHIQLEMFLKMSWNP